MLHASCMPMKSTDTSGCYTEALLGQLFGVNYLNVAADTLLTMFAIKLSAGLCVKKKNTLKDVVGRKYQTSLIKHFRKGILEPHSIYVKHSMFRNLYDISISW